MEKSIWKNYQSPKVQIVKLSVNRQFIEMWEANITTGESEGIPLIRMLKDMLESAGVEVK